MERKYHLYSVVQSFEMDQTLSSLYNQVTYVIVFRMLRDAFVSAVYIAYFKIELANSHTKIYLL